MSDCIKITLIVCGTIIFCNVLSLFVYKSIWNKKTRKDENTFDNSRFIHCKSPTYPAPPRPGYQPKQREPGTQSAKDLKNIKPPSTGSGIK